ncbi:MAG: ATP-binding protein [Aeromicrobium erythreum]
MSRVVFMCGPAGSGKTAYATRLEAQGMVRLSIDAELWRRGVVEAPVDPTVEAEVESDLREELRRLVDAGRDVVLDLSFWSRRMRDEWRQLLEPFGIVPETFYLATDPETVLRRLRGRRGAHGDDVVVPDALAARYLDDFEVPTPDEGPLTVVR